MNKHAQLRYIYGQKDERYKGVPIIANFMFEGSKAPPLDPMAHETRLVLGLVSRLSKEIANLIDSSSYIWGEEPKNKLEGSNEPVYGAVVRERSDKGTVVALIHRGYLAQDYVLQVRKRLILHAETNGLRKPVGRTRSVDHNYKFERRVSLDRLKEKPLSLTFDEWRDLICEQQQVSAEELLGKSRKAHLVCARHLLSFFLYELSDSHTFKQIGRELNRDHTSIIHGVQSVRTDLIQKPDVRSHAEVIFAAALELDKT